MKGFWKEYGICINRCIFFAASVLLLLGVDQYTKYLASAYLKGGHSIVLIENVFQLHYLENRGAAFGVRQCCWFISVRLRAEGSAGYGLTLCY